MAITVCGTSAESQAACSNGVMTADPDAIPYPPPFRWVKRLLVAAVVYVLSLAAVWVGWHWVAAARVDAARAAIRAAGHPATADELTPAPSVPDVENAALAWGRAAAARKPKVYSPAESNLVYPDYPPFPPAWHDLADKAVAANGPAYAAARQARAMKRADWGITLSRTNFNIGHLNPMRGLANQLGDAALHAHVRGDDLAAIERSRDILAQARALTAGPTLMSQLISAGVNALATNRLAAIAPGLRLKSNDDDDDPLRASVRATIAELLDVAPDRAAYARAMRTEVAMVGEWLQAEAGLPRILRPAVEMRHAEHLHRMNAAADAATEPDRPAVERKLRPAAQPPAGKRELLLPRGLRNDLAGRSTEMILRVEGARRMTAVSLAAQLYRADHDGRWPAKLDDLVPRYLPAVPQDTHGDAAPLGYALLDDGRRPIVYSRGPDGADDIAAGWRPPREPSYGWMTEYSAKQGTGARDQWHDLTRFMPPAPPSTAEATADQP